MRKKPIRIAIIAVAIILLLSNYFSPYIRVFAGEGIGKAYEFTTADQSFTYHYIPTKGGTIENMEVAFREYDEKVVIYRKFKKKPLRFWNWYRYATSPMYKYSYYSAKQPSGKILSDIRKDE